MRQSILMATIAVGAALACGSAQAQSLTQPFAFLAPPAQDEIAPQAVEPEPAVPEDNEDAQMDPRLQRQVVDYRGKEAPGTIIVDTPHTYLYYVLGDGKAIRYGIGVGREGFTWSGTHPVVRKAEWPDWYPPQEMIARQPYLPRMTAGGPGNPLGARALYIGGTVYRIHGTNDPSTIGKTVSSGCIRLTNEDIIDLYDRAQVGAKVVVLPQTTTAQRSRQTLGANTPSRTDGTRDWASLSPDHPSGLY
jgi:lipoprotein-anchoring transpeptidase ErfK/SrfK